MKVFSRDFTLKEKIVLYVLVLLLLGLGYYFFIDQPVREGIAAAESSYEMYSSELSALQIKISQLEAMRTELESSTSDKTRMPSYNSNQREIDFLNSILTTVSDYTVTFKDVTRNGDQIRRNFTLQFVAADYQTARALLAALSSGELRCKLGDVYYSGYNKGNSAGYSVNVSVSAVFYETMVGGTADGGLPADSGAAKTNTDAAK